MQLVYLSPVPWQSFAQRPHKFVEWFHARTGGSVLWLDPYPVRFPNWNDLRRATLSVENRYPSSHPDWLSVLKPGGWPIEPIPGAHFVNKILWTNVLREVTSYSERDKTLLAIGKPSALALLLLVRLRNCSSLYDAMDDFPEFHSGISRLALTRREQELVRCVDVMLVSSSGLKRRWDAHHNDVRLVLNGLDDSIINSVAPSQKRINDKFVFGYVGTIASWFDWDWVCELALARPHDEVRLIGPVHNPAPSCLPANVAILPPCDHFSALRAMSDFDVGLIPFKRNSLTFSVDPIKYYEYRALGLPVISTDFGEMSRRIEEPGVFLCRDSSSIPVMANASLEYECDVVGREEFICRNSWGVRFDSAGLF